MVVPIIGISIYSDLVLIHYSNNPLNFWLYQLAKVQQSYRAKKYCLTSQTQLTQCLLISQSTSFVYDS